MRRLTNFTGAIHEAAKGSRSDLQAPGLHDTLAGQRPLAVMHDAPPGLDEAAGRGAAVVRVVCQATGGTAVQRKVCDLEAALARMDGDRTLLREIIAFFFEDSPGLLEEIRRGIRDQQADTLGRAAHSLKGMVANFGADRAFDAAFALEALGDSQSLADAPQALQTLEREIHSLRTALRPYR